jgi:hypothetical protein
MLKRTSCAGDEHLDAMNAAALAFSDQVGFEGYIQWLRHELSRVTATQLRHAGMLPRLMAIQKPYTRICSQTKFMLPAKLAIFAASLSCHPKPSSFA